MGAAQDQPYRAGQKLEAWIGRILPMRACCSKHLTLGRLVGFRKKKGDRVSSWSKVYACANANGDHSYQMVSY